MKDEFVSKKVLQWKMNLNPKNVTMKDEFVSKKMLQWKMNLY